MNVTIRYFAGARAAAGVETENLSLPDDTLLAALADQLAQQHGTGLARVLSASSFLINEVAGAPDRAIPDGATVDVLPPFAGG